MSAVEISVGDDKSLLYEGERSMSLLDALR